MRTCRVNGVSYAVLSTLPIPLYPPVIAAFAPAINHMIFPGDTVYIFPDIVDCFLGCGIDIEANREAVFASSIPVHPKHDQARLSTRPFSKNTANLEQRPIHRNLSRCRMDSIIWGDFDGNLWHSSSCSHQLHCMDFSRASHWSHDYLSHPSLLKPHIWTHFWEGGCLLHLLQCHIWSFGKKWSDRAQNGVCSTIGLSHLWPIYQHK